MHVFIQWCVIDNSMQQCQQQPTRVESMEVSENENQVTSQVLPSLSPSLLPGFEAFEKNIPRRMGSCHNMSPAYLFPLKKAQCLFHDTILAKHGLNPRDNDFLSVEV